ncbi:protein scabrous-like [Stegodyphus dumicola]|uniref:protein scabrous-like n=1 Tax=Stegodyphus dumicola TaxID=202533 RepID=UPI0015AD5C63|nr:protein scabrous-like [Stegodyphus dumicola]
MWVVTVLLAMTLSCGAREPLREQVAMLRREQWRDRERIEALEQKLLDRDVRDSPSESHQDVEEVLYEVMNEVMRQTDDLLRLKNLESMVFALQARQEREASTVRRLSEELKIIRQRQQKISSQLNGKNWNIEEGSGEGSGDVMGESFIPVDQTTVVTPEVNKSETDLTVLTTDVYEEEISSIELYGKRFEKRLTDFESRLEEVRGRMERAEETCAIVASNATNVMEISKERVQNIQESFVGLQKNVSKVTFSNYNIQAALHVLTEDQASDRSRIRELQEAQKRTEHEINNQRHRLTSVEMIATNSTLQRCRSDAKDMNRDLKIADLEVKLNQAHRRMDERARLSEMSRNANEHAIRRLRDSVSEYSRLTGNISGELMKVTEHQDQLRNELSKFIRQLPRDCSRETESGVKLINVPTLGPTEVYCDTYTEGGPWLVVQNRADGSENFYRSWKEYRNGFGKPEGEHWLGNEILYLLTKDRQMKLRIDMRDTLGHYLFAEYDDFKVKSEENLYTLVVGRYSGNASDALSHHSGMGFSTHDKDNDASSTNCAMHYTAGWWYQHCHRADLNGRFAIGMTWYDEQKHDWIQLQSVDMKIKPLGS